MTLPTIHVTKLVIAAGMAILTEHSGMPALERELGGRMIECRWFPSNSRVAGGTIERELPGKMPRILRSVVVGFMALSTIRVCQRVIAADVALLAGGRDMLSGQRKTRCRVVELRWFPGCGAVAFRAVMGNLSRDMVRVLRLGVFALMALPAVAVGETVVAVRMTFITGGAAVRTGEREVRCGVIEARWFPGTGCVTFETIVIEFAGNVVRLLRRGELALMALVTIRVCQGIVPVHVTFIACGRDVRPGEWKHRCAVIEDDRFPVRCRMTARTIVIEFPRHVVRGRDRIVFILMTCETIRVGESVIPVCMAFIAGGCGVYSGQWKLRRPMIECGRFPSACCVAGQTIMIKLGGDMIRDLRLGEILLMALITVGVCKVVVAVGVTLFASRWHMFPGEWKLRRCMIEDGRFPRRRVVAGDTVVRKPAVDMAGCDDGVELCIVTLKTIQVEKRVVAIVVAVFTGYGPVGAGQRELCRRMIER